MSKNRVRQNRNRRNAAKASKRKPSKQANLAGKHRETVRRRAMALYEQGLMRPVPEIPSMPATPYQEIALRGFVGKWEAEMRKRTSTSARTTMNSLDTVGHWKMTSGGEIGVTVPLVALAGTASGIRRFPNGIMSILLTCVYGWRDGTWAFVDDHIWLDTAKLAGAGVGTAIRLFDDLVIVAAPKGYDRKGMHRVGVGLWSVDRSELPYRVRGRKGFKPCPPIAGGELDLLRIEDGEEGPVLACMEPDFSEPVRDLLLREEAGWRELDRVLREIRAKHPKREERTCHA